MGSICSITPSTVRTIVIVAHIIIMLKQITLKILDSVIL